MLFGAIFLPAFIAREKISIHFQDDFIVVQGKGKIGKIQPKLDIALSTIKRAYLGQDKFWFELDTNETIKFNRYNLWFFRKDDYDEFSNEFKSKSSVYNNNLKGKIKVLKFDQKELKEIAQGLMIIAGFVLIYYIAYLISSTS